MLERLGLSEPFESQVKEAAMSGNGYTNLFVNEGDLPPGMRMAQDRRSGRPDDGDVAFAEYRGLHSGMAVWLGSETDPVWRIVDIRWVFPTESDAAAYHRATLSANSEGDSPVSGAPPVGQECRVFGGPKVDPVFGLRYTSYFYIFRVGRVVVKLFAAEGDMAAQRGQSLTPRHMTPIAERIVSRVTAVCPVATTVAPLSSPRSLLDRFRSAIGIGLPPAAPAPVPPSLGPAALLGSRLADARRTDFFTWFHLEPVTSSADRPEARNFRPSGSSFRDLVLVTATLGPDDRIRAVELLIARSFIANRQNGAFAGDIAWSFLSAIVCGADASRIADLAKEIKHLFLAPGPLSPPSQGLLTYTGQQASYEEVFEGCALRLENVATSAGHALRLTTWARG